MPGDIDIVPGHFSVSWDTKLGFLWLLLMISCSWMMNDALELAGDRNEPPLVSSWADALLGLGHLAARPMDNILERYSFLVSFLLHTSRRGTLLLALLETMIRMGWKGISWSNEFPWHGYFLVATNKTSSQPATSKCETRFCVDRTVGSGRQSCRGADYVFFYSCTRARLARHAATRSRVAGRRTYVQTGDGRTFCPKPFPRGVSAAACVCVCVWRCAAAVYTLPTSDGRVK